eukprot:7901578-Alexandrium_andersonii.AAC.1
MPPAVAKAQRRERPSTILQSEIRTSCCCWRARALNMLNRLRRSKLELHGPRNGLKIQSREA